MADRETRYDDDDERERERDSKNLRSRHILMILIPYNSEKYLWFV